jgi:small ligand-binding sensory domain FIST
VRGFAIETGIDAAGEATLRGELPLHDPTRASAILLGDPFSLPVEPLLQRIGEEAPGLPVIGGLASGGHGPGQNLLLQREGVRSEGGVGVILEGRYSFRPVVSQGCRPVGRPFVITASEENVILRLGGKPALDGLLSTLEALPPEERELMQRAPFLGLAVDPAKSEFERGDFLVRGLLGIRPQDRSLVVADQVRRGQTVQFLVRDTHSAGEDLERLLAAAVPRRAVDRAQGALLFSCSGRGRAMFGERDHDVRHLRRALGPDLALAGFFAGGELGPVAGRNFLHGFTASVALLVDRL